MNIHNRTSVFVKPYTNIKACNIYGALSCERYYTRVGKYYRYQTIMNKAVYVLNYGRSSTSIRVYL